MKRLTAIALSVVALTMVAGNSAPAFAKTGKATSAIKKSLSLKAKKRSSGAVFRKRYTNDTRRLSDGRGPGFELGFDGHTGGD